MPLSTNLADWIPLNSSCRYFPGRPHRATVWRWALSGIVRHGRTVKLVTKISGGRRFTSQAAIQQFLSDCNADAAVHHDEPPLSRAEAAGRMLDARGVR